MSFFPRAPLVRSIVAAALVLTGAACAGRARPSVAAPVDPEAAVRSFLNAVRANSLVAMGELWGTDRGPASQTMERDVLEQRLTVIRIYLDHEDYELLATDPALVASPGDERVVRVRLTRQGCMPVVPFTTVRYGTGWLISNIDIAAVGNPARPCA